MLFRENKKIFVSKKYWAELEIIWHKWSLCDPILLKLIWFIEEHGGGGGVIIPLFMYM